MKSGFFTIGDDLFNGWTVMRDHLLQAKIASKEDNEGDRLMFNRTFHYNFLK